ncbi:shikimate dehydrogenase [Aquibacillus albus]|uniref:Shikimate dehydrogenase (NADP(+)) n=1 Tax=Aquibacillus albus TaxID=1168171 RepID=A0ABS2MUS1_9BACI|nr:shikimate dehydrogenase [Aquibacillus albus]MBM7569593.1 shikimate dehydrogenase [Aquibacillus albus]
MGLSLGLIGYPINHSLSPWIHHQFMEKLGLEGEYVLYETSSDQLKKTVYQLMNKQVDGFNITVPYKQDIIPLLDELHPDAEKIGAVNTVVKESGKWTGYNTDGQGYVRSVKTEFPELFTSKSKVLILGAGGAARGIYRALVQEPFSTIDIANRTLKKAESFIPLKEDHVSTDVLSFSEAEENLYKYDYIVQTTSVGMKPNINDKVLSLRKLKPKTVVSDIVYQPLMTTLLKDAIDRGGRIHQGHAMLLYQAQLAFEIWTNKRPPLDDTLIKLEERLRGNS